MGPGAVLRVGGTCWAAVRLPASAVADRARGPGGSASNTDGGVRTMELTVPELPLAALVGPSGSGKVTFAARHTSCLPRYCRQMRNRATGIPPTTGAVHPRRGCPRSPASDRHPAAHPSNWLSASANSSWSPSVSQSPVGQWPVERLAPVAAVNQSSSPSRRGRLAGRLGGSQAGLGSVAGLLARRGRRGIATVFVPRHRRQQRSFQAER